LTHETVASNVISQLVGVAAKLNVIAKICKYRGLHEGLHFIMMAMEVHVAFGRDMDRFIKKCYCLFHDRLIMRSFILVFFHSIFQATC
jgi:hypothetical protein